MSGLEDPTLRDPDAGADIKYGWDKEFQRHIAALLIGDRQFLLQSLDLVRPSYFSDRAHSIVTDIAFDFFKKYRLMPRKDFVVQEIKDRLKDNKSLPYYLAEVNVLYDYFQPGMESRDYLQNKIIYFAKIQAVKRAFSDSLKMIDSSPESDETWNKVYDKMRDSMTTHQNFDIGVDYFKNIKDRYAEMVDLESLKDRFFTGLEGIDKEIAGGGYCRGELISIVAGSGVGKSVMLACIAATNLLRGKKGIYISLELAEKKIADRMDAILTGFPVQNLYGHKDEIFAKLATLDNVDLSEGVGPLVIKQFPAGTATVNTIRAYISQLRFQGFNPDFVIVDYVGEMQDYPDMKTYESREKIVRDLRGMVTEENLFGATAMQPNRDSKSDQKTKGERGRIDDSNLADSFGQIRPLDGCLSLNQNDNEKLLGIGRGYIIKQRDGKSRYQIYLKFDKENLRITEISQNEYVSILNAFKEKASDEVAFDMVRDNLKKKGYKPGGSEDVQSKVDDMTSGVDAWNEVANETYSEE